jgi:hypothetical protein
MRSHTRENVRPILKGCRCCYSCCFRGYFSPFRLGKNNDYSDGSSSRESARGDWNGGSRKLSCDFWCVRCAAHNALSECERRNAQRQHRKSVESFFPAKNGVKLIDFIQDLKNSETRLVFRPMNNNVYSEETNGHGVIMTSSSCAA